MLYLSCTTRILELDNQVFGKDRYQSGKNALFAGLPQKASLPLWALNEKLDYRVKLTE